MSTEHSPPIDPDPPRPYVRSEDYSAFEAAKAHHEACLVRAREARDAVEATLVAHDPPMDSVYAALGIPHIANERPTNAAYIVASRAPDAYPHIRAAWESYNAAFLAFLDAGSALVSFYVDAAAHSEETE